MQDHEELDDVVADVHAAGLVLSAYQDENGEEMVRFAADPDVKLGDLVSWNELLPFTKLEPNLETILEVRQSLHATLDNMWLMLCFLLFSLSCASCFNACWLDV